MAPYFDLTVGPPPTERSLNAIESERDLRHRYARHGSTDNNGMRRHKRPDSIPRYNNDATEQLHRHFLFDRIQHRFLRQYRHFHVDGIGWVGRHDPDSDTNPCANSDTNSHASPYAR